MFKLLIGFYENGSNMHEDIFARKSFCMQENFCRKTFLNESKKVNQNKRLVDKKQKTEKSTERG